MADETRLGHVAADVLVDRAQVEGAVEVAACAGAWRAERERALVRRRGQLEDGLGHHPALGVAPDVGMCGRAVPLHEVAADVLDIIDGVLDRPSDRAVRGRRGRVAQVERDLEHLVATRELRADVRGRDVPGIGHDRALIGGVAVRVNEEPAVPRLGDNDQIVGTLHAEGLDGAEGERGGGGGEDERSEERERTHERSHVIFLLQFGERAADAFLARILGRDARAGAAPVSGPDAAVPGDHDALAADEVPPERRSTAASSMRTLVTPHL